jgi:hypothetical protein
MKKFVAVILLCMALADMASCAGQAENSSNTCPGCNVYSVNATNMTDTDMNKTTYTFIQEGNGGSFVKDSSGNYTLTITETVPYTLYFSDRPARVAGFAPMDKFLRGFCFNKSNPPNAAIMIKDGEEDSDVIMVELTVPRYDEENRTLMYMAKMLDNYTFASSWAQDIIPMADDSIPESFGPVNIVIDNCLDGYVLCCKVLCPWGCCGRIKTGCCWSSRDFECEACRNSNYYVSKCKEKFGKACAEDVRDFCVWT